MDAVRFDALTRGLAGVRSRRGLLASLAGGLAAAGEITPIAARRRRCLKDGTRCTAQSGGKGDNCDHCCSRFSKPRRRGGRRCACALVGKACTTGKQCCSGICDGTSCRPCQPGFQDCNGSCIPDSICCSDSDCGTNELCGGEACDCMPDPSSCLAPGTQCPGNDCATCCAPVAFYVCGSGQLCCGDSVPGYPCGAGVRCASAGNRQDCQCNRCCIRSGVRADIFGNGTCATCCSGECATDGVTCA